jgi:hypothetical protein
MKSYSLQKHQGQWMMRWSDYKKVDGVRKRSQPHYMVASVKNFPKKKDVVPLADAQFARVKRSRTVAAGATLSEFVKTAFVPNAETLASGTRKLYKQHWKRLEPHLGQMRLRNVMTPHIQAALDAIHDERKETLSHDTYLAIKVTASAIFTVAIRRGDHPGPNPENNTTVRSYGHHEKRPNGAYNLSEIRQFLTLFPTGDVAVAIGINAFLALRKPEVEALTPEDFDAASGLVRVHAHTKTKNDEKLPVIAPLRRMNMGGLLGIGIWPCPLNPYPITEYISQ